MSFSTNINTPSPEITTLLSIRPRVLVNTWVSDPSVVGQNVHTFAWDKENVVGIYDRSFNSMEEKATAAEVDAEKGTWFFDSSTGIIRANFIDYGPEGDIIPGPNYFTRPIVVEWDMFFATKALNWYRNPMESSSEDQRWEGGLMKPPIPQQGNPDLLFGFSPVRVTNVEIALFDSEAMKYLNTWSLNGSRMKIWECAGDLETANISEIFTGVGGSFYLKNGVLSIEITDPMLLVQQAQEAKYFDRNVFANLDPNRSGAALRRVFGCVNGFIGVNVDFNDTPATDNNRQWVISQGQANKAQIVREIDTGAANTNSRTYLIGGVRGLRVGDSVVIEQSGTPTYEIIVSTVNYDDGYFDHSFISARVITSGDEVRRGFIGQITLDDGEGNAFPLAYERDWTEADFAQDSKGFILTDNFEASLAGAPAIFNPGLHVLYCTVYGDALTPKKLDGVTDLCALADNGGSLANPVGLLWNILRNEIRVLREIVAFDEDGWAALAQSIDRGIGFALPLESTGDWGDWKDVVQRILQSELLRLHIEIQNGLATLTITRDGPIGAVNAEVGQEELREPSWTWDMSDVYDTVAVSFNNREFDSSFFYGAEQSRFASVSNLARYLHRVSRTLEIETLHYENEDASAIVAQLSAIVSERRGILSGVLPASFTERSIGDTVQYGSRFLPGESVSGSINTRAMKLQRHAKSPAGVTVSLEDQKGIEDFTGDWLP